MAAAACGWSTCRALGAGGGRLHPATGHATAVAVAGHYAYLSTTLGGLRVIDVTTPSAPVEVGFLRPSGGSASDVAVAGRLALLAYDSGGLRVIDVSVPSAPVEVGVVPAPAGMKGLKVAVAHGFAYVSWLASSGSDGLSVIDLSEPSAPVEVGHVEEAIWAVTPVVVGGQVFLTSGGVGLSVCGDCATGPIADGRDSFIPAAAVAAGAEGAFFQPTSRSTTPAPTRHRCISSGCRAARTTPSR